MRLISKVVVRTAEAFGVVINIIHKAHLFIHKANLFINSFVVVILTPEEIASYTKQVYQKKTSYFALCTDQDWIDKGLNPSEKDVIEKHAGKSGSFIVLCCGAGREAIPLAKMGFDVIGIDSSAAMIHKAKEFATREGMKVDLLIGDILEMPFLEGGFDYCLLSCFMYSVIPSRTMRVTLLSNILDLLNDGGIAIIHFVIDRNRRERLFKLRKSIASIFKGNVSYQTGDDFYPPGHFFRRFLDEQEVIDEVREAGLFVKEILRDQDSHDGIYAVLEKISHQ